MSAAAATLALAFAVLGVGVAAALLLPARSSPTLLAIAGAGAALLVVLAGGRLLLLDEAAFRITLWTVPELGPLTLAADRLSALFLLVTGLVFLPVSLYSAGYLAHYREHHDLRYFSLLYHVLLASVVLVVLADDVISFLIAWEIMSIASYLLVSFEHERAESASAAFVMLAMSEAGTIAVALAFLLIGTAAGSLAFADWRAAPPALGTALGWAVFLLSFYGFGVKAGLVPLNSWLPLAHPVAPTNVSALLSAVIVNLGIYGIIRVNLDLAPTGEVGPGLVVLVTGSVSALIGILYATIQAELKRLLAHSTIENMGIVAAGIGAAIVLLASGHPTVGGIALIAALYHMANHSIYKALLFLGAGAVEAGARSRDLDRLGGLARRMPWTSALFLVGTLAIAALPPLNGFVSEWLTLQTMLRSTLLASTATKIVFAVSGALLALTAGLAVTCFAKVFAMGFLGMPRSEEAAAAKEAPRGMRTPLGLLAALCLALGVLPTFVIPALDRVVGPLAHESVTPALVPPFLNVELQAQEQLPAGFVAEFHDLGAQLGAGTLPGRGLVVLHRGEAQNPVVFAMSTSYTICAFLLILALVYLAFRVAAWRRRVARGPAWDGGLRRLSPQMTYTATGFSNPVRVVFQALVSPAAKEDSTEAVGQHFRMAIRREYAEFHIVDRLVVAPPVWALGRLAALARRMHVGNVNAYAAYVLIAMLLALVVGAGLP